MDITVAFIKRWKETLCSRFSIKFWNYIYGGPIVLIFFMYNIGDGMLDAVLRPNIPQIACLNMFPDKCRNPEITSDLENDVQKQATKYIIYHKVLSNVPALIFGLFCGAWSDKHGRKLPMVQPSIGTTFAIVMYMLANVSPTQISVALFLSASFIQGCFGKSSLFLLAVHSYVVDTTDPSGRTNKLGLLAAMRFFGMFIGSLIAGLLIDNTNVLTTYCTASACNALVVILALTVLKETFSANQITEVFPGRTIFKPDNLKYSLMVLIKRREFNIRRSICVLLLVNFLHQTCLTGKIFSVLGSLETIAKFVALIVTALYGVTSEIFPGMSFLIASGLYVTMSFLCLFIHFSTRGYLKRENSVNDSDSSSRSNEFVEMNSNYI